MKKKQLSCVCTLRRCSGKLLNSVGPIEAIVFKWNLSTEPECRFNAKEQFSGCQLDHFRNERSRKCQPEMHEASIVQTTRRERIK